MRFSQNYQDRTDGVIVIDSAPIDLNPIVRQNETSRVVMQVMRDITDRGLSINEAKKEIQQKFSHLKNIEFLILRMIDQTSPDKIKWTVNFDTLYKSLPEIWSFDTSKQYSGPCFHVVGGKSYVFNLEVYQKVFPNIKREDVVVIEGAGHWVHFEKPQETMDLVGDFLKRID